MDAPGEAINNQMIDVKADQLIQNPERSGLSRPSAEQVIDRKIWKDLT